MNKIRYFMFLAIISIVFAGCIDKQEIKKPDQINESRVSVTISITPEPNQTEKLVRISQGEAEKLLHNFILNNTELLNITNSSQLRLESIRCYFVECIGWSVYYQQYYNGVLVEGGRVSIIIKGDKIDSYESTFVKDINISTKPKISDNESFATIKRSILADRASFSKPTLVVYKYQLAWKMEVITSKPFVGTTYFVNAHTGEIIGSSVTFIPKPVEQGGCIRLYETEPYPTFSASGQPVNLTIRISQQEAENLSYDFILSNIRLLKITNISKLRLESIEPYADTYWSVDYQQYYDSLVVERGGVSMTIRGNKIDSYESIFYNINISTTPRISENESIEIVKSKDGIKVSSLSKPSLVIYDCHLAWKVDIRLVSPDPYHGYWYLVDAHTGDILTKYPSVIS